MKGKIIFLANNIEELKMIRLSVTVKGNKKIGLYVFEYNLIFFANYWTK